MSAELRTVTTPNGEVVYNSNMPIKALKAVMGASKTGDLDSIVEGFAAFVTEWPHEGDPTDAEAWDELGRREFNDIVTSVMEDLGELGNE